MIVLELMQHDLSYIMKFNQVTYREKIYYLKSIAEGVSFLHD